MGEIRVINICFLHKKCLLKDNGSLVTKTDRHTDTQTGRQTDRPTERQITDQPGGRQTDRQTGGGMAELFRALDLKSGGPWFKSSTLLLSGFVLGSPEFNSSTELCK